MISLLPRKLRFPKKNPKRLKKKSKNPLPYKLERKSLPTIIVKNDLTIEKIVKIANTANSPKKNINIIERRTLKSIIEIHPQKNTKLERRLKKNTKQKSNLNKNISIE